jgi:hypothetical protein
VRRTRPSRVVCKYAACDAFLPTDLPYRLPYYPAVVMVSITVVHHAETCAGSYIVKYAEKLTSE